MSATNPGCVRVDHLRVDGAPEAKPRRQARERAQCELFRPGMSELRVGLGRWENGRLRSFTRTVPAESKAAAAVEAVMGIGRRGLVGNTRWAFASRRS